MIPQDDFSAFFEGYTACALWSSTADDGTPLDANYGELDLSGITRKRFEEDCRAFCEQNLEDLTAVARGSYTWARAGHDFWLTRNGHGAGFLDRGDAPEWDRLTEAARGFCASTLYAGGGQLHLRRFDMVAEYHVPHGLDVRVRITTLGDTKFVEVLAPLYARKEWRASFCFSSAFSDRAILESRELSTVLINAYGST